MTDPAPLRSAATVVMVRAGENGRPEVLLVRRHDGIAFMGGAFVFPGGRVDERDRSSSPSAPLTRRFGDLPLEDEWAYRLAAVRETREEAALVIDSAALLPIAHWVTPDHEPRRYDTRFFLAVAPAGQTARSDAGETTELVWIAPADAIARSRAGKMKLPPPTWTTLRQLEACATVETVVEWARTLPLVRIQPRLNNDDGMQVLTLPGDPLFADVPPGWKVPAETRFLLDNLTGWRPVPAVPG